MGDLKIEYRDIPSAPGYRAGSDGSIFSAITGKTLKPWLSGSSVKYLYICLGSKLKGSVHRFICEAFHGPCPPGMEVCHNDGNPLNNCADNLRWGTHSDNVRDTIRHGRHKPRNFAKPGERKRGPKPTVHPRAEEIINLHRSGSGYKAIADVLGMSKSGVANIIKNRCAA